MPWTWRDAVMAAWIGFALGVLVTIAYVDQRLSPAVEAGPYTGRLVAIRLDPRLAKMIDLQPGDRELHLDARPVSEAERKMKARR